jgi:Tol biopolymer transport system component
MIKGEVGERDIWSKSLEPGAVEVPVVVSPFDQSDPQVSPDGKWLAYVSNESGRPEVYVCPFSSGTSSPSSIGCWQVSKDGAEGSTWSADGKELFFLHGGTNDPSAANAHRTLLSVSVATADGFVPGEPKVAFEWNGLAPCCPSPDGKRELFMRRRDRPIRSTEIYATLHWF